MADNSIYLIAKYTGMPKDPRQTAKPGYMTNPENIHYEEQVYISRGLRDKDLKNQVVLNLTEEKIVKNTFKSGATFEEAFSHYYESYAEYIDDCVNTLNEALQTK
jgi:hypothetical protein